MSEDQTDPLLLPEGSRLVHIGPHKTGTTALQWALHHAREALHEQGVHYAHHRPQAYRPAVALTGLKGRIGAPKAHDDKPWRTLVAEIEAQHDRRVVVSSESFANAGRPHIERLVRDLGPDRVHIVRMLRRYDTILPSQWQQTVAGGGRQTFAGYLDAVRSDPRHGFWRRHGFATLTRRWAEVVGPENLTAVVVDERDHDWLLRVMERLTGLRPGTLQAEPDRTNRSLTRAEVELLRRFNVLRHEEAWVDKVHYEYIRRGASPAMRRLPPDPAGGRIAVPDRYLPLLAEATERDLAALRGLGVRVVGDLSLLVPPPPAVPGTPEAAAPGPPSMAVASVATAVDAVVARAETDGSFPLLGPGAARTSEPASSLPSGDGGAESPSPPPSRRLRAAVVRRLRRPRRLYVVPPEGPAADALRATFAAAAAELDRTGRSAAVVGRPGDLDRLARSGVDVLVVVAPPRQRLAARWHHHVLHRRPAPYTAWLADQCEDDPTPACIRAAVDRLGADHVSVLVSDCYEPRRTQHALEEITGLRPGSLGDRARAVTSWSESVLLRDLDERAARAGWPPGRWERYVRDGVLPRLLSVPPAALDRTHPLDEAAAAWVSRESTALLAAIEGTGVPVRGGLRLLRRGSRAHPGPTSESARLRPGTGALALAGAVSAADRRP